MRVILLAQAGFTTTWDATNIPVVNIVKMTARLFFSIFLTILGSSRVLQSFKGSKECLSDFRLSLGWNRSN